MKTKLTEKEIKDRTESKSYRTYDDLYQFDNITKQYQVDESGICFFDKDKNVVSMYKIDLVEDTNTTMKKVIAVCDLGEEEIKKMDKVRHIIKGFLEICFRKKISVFLLSMAFIYMNIMGIKEKFYLMNLMYTWGFFMITDTSKAIRFIKETLEEYKLREEALVDKEFMEFYNTAVDDDMEDMKLYLILSNTNEKRL
ncbi:MAG: hypothetical protein E7171_08415 [Firmicutes bacterium]|nr:hypothetical protein [Bacillota bacterium]